MLGKIDVKVSAYPTERLLKSRWPVPDEVGKCLEKFRELVAEIDREDSRYGVWFVERLVEHTIRDIVREEVEAANLMALASLCVDDQAAHRSYSEAAEKCRTIAARLTKEWRALAALHGYLRNTSIENDARGLAEFLRERHGPSGPDPITPKGKKS